jgi:hypothetical protein
MISEPIFSLGWKIAAEQQIASMKAEGFHIESGNKKTNPISEDNPFHQILANMREASMSLYEQYLSEKVSRYFLPY